MEALRERPYGFDFHQALRRIECAFPGLPRLGTSRRAAEDPVRLGQMPSTAFAPSTVAAFDGGTPPSLLVHFLGLLGPNGPMPLHFTEYVREQWRNAHDPTLKAFLDVFHHRLLCVFHRAWASSQQAVGRDRRDDDRFAAFIGGFAGLGTGDLVDRDSVPHEAKLFYAGHLSRQTRNAEGLGSILADFFAVPTDIEQWVGTWVELPPAYRLRLGESPETGALGQTAMVGERFWDCQQKFRVILGPMGLADYERLLPDGPSFRRLVDWIRNYTGDQLEWDAQLILERDEVPATQLGGGARLGWTSWLSTRPFEDDADDLIIQPSAA